MPVRSLTAMATYEPALTGGSTALVNNAGVAVFAPLLDTSDEDWNRILAVNLTGPFFVYQGRRAPDARAWRRRGGEHHLDLGVRASTLRSAYGTSKAGLAHLTKQLAVELASLGIRVNGVAPGRVETAMAKQVHTPEIRADYHDAITAKSLWPRRGTGGSGVLPVLRTARATSPGRFWPSTAVLTPPASACRTLRGERRNG